MSFNIAMCPKASLRGEGEGEGEKLSPTPFDACYAGYPKARLKSPLKRMTPVTGLGDRP